jgi:Opacity protein and related surface antigens
MKKVLSVMAVSAFVLTAGSALAGGPGKSAANCPEGCQRQIDDLQSSQAQQDELLNAHGRKLQDHEVRITDLEKAFNDYWYVRLGARVNWMEQKVGDYYDVDTDAGFGGSIAFGREFAMYQALGKFRAEIELAKQAADFEETYAIGLGTAERWDGTLDVTSIFLNGYYELPIYDAFSMYFMAGVGYAKYDIDFDTFYYVGGTYAGYGGNYGSSDNVLAYKAGIGVTWNFTDQIAADLGYEYLGVADTDIADSINGHNVVLSVRFKF